MSLKPIFKMDENQAEHVPLSSVIHTRAVPNILLGPNSVFLFG